MSYIYLASPYTDPSDAIMQYRYNCALDATAQLTRAGLVVYSPIVHCHMLATMHDLRRDALYWQRYNEVMLSRAAMLMILRLTGWQRSEGIKKERQCAVRHRIPISFMDYDESPFVRAAELSRRDIEHKVASGR
jgi:hypothetical protein